MAVLWSGRSTVTTVATVVRVLPVVIVTVLTGPGWLCFPFLSRDRRAAILDLLQGLIAWTRVASVGADEDQTRPPGGSSSENPVAR